jgi:NAD(P)-dependent dehydrogenase (short-subunit alcohol dehydrogenase family)
MQLALMDVAADKLEAVAGELDAIAVPVDLASTDATQAAIDRALAELGTPDVLVHNAALLRPLPFSEITLDEWDRTVNIIIQAAYILTKACWQPMTDTGGGSVIYVSSRSGIEGFVDETHYCAAKHALEGFMKSLAMEGKTRNIAVNTITPGMYMHTPMSEQNYPDELKAKWVDPMMLTPAFLQLAVQDATGITGQRLDAWQMSESIRSQTGQ